MGRRKKKRGKKTSRFLIKLYHRSRRNLFMFLFCFFFPVAFLGKLLKCQNGKMKINTRNSKKKMRKKVEKEKEQKINRWRKIIFSRKDNASMSPCISIRFCKGFRSKAQSRNWDRPSVLPHFWESFSNFETRSLTDSAGACACKWPGGAPGVPDAGTVSSFLGP